MPSQPVAEALSLCPVQRHLPQYAGTIDDDPQVVKRTEAKSLCYSNLNMPPHLQLRTPNLDDLGSLTQLGRDTFVETFGDLYSPEDLQAFLTDVYSEKSVLEELNNPDLHFQILTKGSELIGYAKIGPVHVPVENSAPAAMELWQLYVRQKFIGQGLGKKLMAWAEAQFAARKATEIYVSVFSENERAIRFYERHGFEKVGEYGFPVGNQIDLEWIMRKTGSGRK